MNYLAKRQQPEKLYHSVAPVVIHPFYHAVCEEYTPHIHSLYKPKNSREFEADLDFLLRHFQPVDAHQVFEYQVKCRPVEQNSFHLSFDDGLREVYEVALPLLQQKGIPATLFINTAFVDNKELFFRHKAALLVDRWRQKPPSPATQKEIDRLLSVPYSERDQLDEAAALLEVDFQDYLKKNKPYLTTEEIKALQQKGFTIGAHSIDHPRYAQLEKTEQIRQTLDSCAYVKKTFNEPKTFFSFPFSEDDVPDSFMKAIRPQVDLSFGIRGMKIGQEGRLVGRIDMEKKGKDAQDTINQAFLKYKILQILLSYT
ncbi:MAG: polysaccharide deacetylase family protein [Dysgonamonadaceae bacterium]|nr:polysaccharide deacetylase family protein [Dysgonamonadaceae bacterium]